MSLLAEVSALYEVADTWEGDRVLVEHPVAEGFSSAVTRFLAALGDEQHEDFWGRVVRPLKALRWRLATTPLPINHAVTGVRETSDLAVPMLRACHETSPSVARDAEDLADLLEHLWGCGDDPMGDAVRAACSNDAPRVVLLLPDGRSADAVTRAFGEAFRVLTASQLLRTRTHRAVAVGPSAWFPPEIIRAPRAAHLTFAYFGWLPERDPEVDLLAGAVSRQTPRLAAPPKRDPSRHRPQVPEVEQDPKDWVPRIEWTTVARAARRHAGGGHGEPVEAQLFVLVSGDGVYLEIKDGAMAWIADLDEEISIAQASVASLREGTFLITRTAGDGDYIRDIADSLLGQRAGHLRELQSRWKAKLAGEIADAGIGAVSRRLARLGAERASENNVRRWAWADSIRPGARSDFNAVCVLVGEPAEALWNAMSEIFRAHLRAGNEVRKLLIDEIRRGDSAALLQRGWSDYDVESVEGEGALRVARIAGRAPDLVRVPGNRLRKPFKVGDDLWLP